MLILRDDEEQGNIGVVYGYLAGREHPWLIRPDGWPSDVSGIAYTENELAFGDDGMTPSSL